MDKMQIYNAARAVPANAIKKITGGAYGAAGLSDINPQWRIERMTELFGPVGTGWTWEPVDVTERDGVLYAHVVVIYYDFGGKQSKPIHGYGGTKFGMKDDSDIYKSTMTDAVSNALRYLGIGADVWYKPDGKANQFDTKYSAPAQRKEQTPPPAIPHEAMVTPAQAEEIKAMLSELEWQAMETKYGAGLGLMTKESYQKVLAKLKARKESAK